MPSCPPMMVITFAIKVGYQPVEPFQSNPSPMLLEEMLPVVSPVHSCAAIRSVSRPVCSTVLCGSRRKL